MVTVARRESRDYRSDVVYGPYVSPTGDCGILQIHIASHAAKFLRHGWTWQVDCYIPEHALVIGREIYDGQGPTAWTTY